MMNMEINLKIDKSSDTPVYRQIVENITQMVKSGIISAGQKLPPERELARRLSASRGTVTRAYEILRRNHVVEIIQGSGTFISKGQDVLMLGRKDVALKKIKSMILSLKKMKFSHREIDLLVNICLMEHEKVFRDFNMAAVDCNPEALSIFELQLSHLTHGHLSKFLLDEFQDSDDFVKKLSPFDLIVTTSTHYAELLSECADYKDKIIQAAVSPSQQTIIDLAGISEKAQIGVICKTRRFQEIVCDKLEELRFNMDKIGKALESDPAEVLSSFIQNHDVLIVYPGANAQLAKSFKQELADLFKRGGEVIEYNYQIERGTLIRIDEKVSEILNVKLDMDGGVF